MPKPQMPMDALQLAILATDEDAPPDINDLRPDWFTRGDYTEKSGVKKSMAERILNGPKFERMRCLSNGHRAWAYRLKRK